MRAKIDMNKKVGALFLAGMLAITSPAFAQPVTDTLRLTLQDALDIAMSENPTVKIADQEIQKQRYGRKGSYSNLFPQIDFSGAYQRTIEKQTFYLDGVPGMENVGVKAGRDNVWNLGFTANMPLVSVPIWKNIQMTGLDVELSVEKARSSRLEMKDQVTRAFYTVLLAKDAYEVFKDAYDNALSNYIDIKGKFDQGLVAEYDLIRANVNLKNAEPSLYDAENSIIIANWHLKALLALDVESNIKCMGSLSDFEEGMIENYLLDDLSLNSNSDLRQIGIQQEMLRKTKQLQISQYYPSLYAQFNYQWMAMHNSLKVHKFKLDPYSTFGVSLSIPIFSGGKRMFDVKKTSVMMTQLDLQRTDAERNLMLAIRQSADQMSTCTKQYRAARAGVEQAELGYTITMKRYETGEGTLLEINDSQLQLTQARLNLNQSIFNYLSAKSMLDKTLGKETEEQTAY